MKKNNVVIFEKRPDKNYIGNQENYKFIVTATVIEYQSGLSIEKKKRAIIEILDIKNDMVKVHCFTEFVLLWKNNSYNTMKNKANTIVRFLNYINKNNLNYKLENFADIEAFHGEDYLSEIAINGSSCEYFHQEKNTLDKFYKFMYKKNLLRNITDEDREKLEKEKIFRKNNKNRRAKILPIYESIFEDYQNPSNIKRQRKLHHLREEFVIPFIETAYEICPRIALGVYMQMFGGLRTSEVVNIRVSGISFLEWGIRHMYVNIGDEIISDQNRDVNQACNKRKRRQSILNVGNYLPRLLKNHLEYNDYIAKDGTNALFSNIRGDVMTAKTYYRNFTKIKNKFIEKLMRNEDIEINQYGLFLKLSSWSTHIGRGIASNFMADATENEFVTAQFRGYTQIGSALVYTEDTDKIRRQIEKSGSDMFEIGIEMKKRLERNIKMEDENGG